MVLPFSQVKPSSIFNALVYARRLLKDSPAKTKHVILLSDGQTMPAGRLDDTASAAVRGDDKPRQRTPYDRFMAEQPKDDGRGNAGFEEIARTIHPHPTFSEAVMEANRAASGWLIHG